MPSVGPNPPVYVGMPPTRSEFVVHREKRKDKPWGSIVCGGACDDDYARIEVYHQTADRTLTLQAAALRSLKDAEGAVGAKILVTGTIRSCAQQAAYYASDSKRYAHPNTTGHTRGLCIDVDTGQSVARKKAIHKALMWRGWHQTRPDDEPWHYSFGIQV